MIILDEVRYAIVCTNLLYSSRVDVRDDVFLVLVDSMSAINCSTNFLLPPAIELIYIMVLGS